MPLGPPDRTIFHFSPVWYDLFWASTQGKNAMGISSSSRAPAPAAAVTPSLRHIMICTIDIRSRARMDDLSMNLLRGGIIQKYNMHHCCMEASSPLWRESVCCATSPWSHAVCRLECGEVLNEQPIIKEEKKESLPRKRRDSKRAVKYNTLATVAGEWFMFE